MLLESDESSSIGRYFLCSKGPGKEGTQDRLLSDRISPPSLTTFSRGAQLGSCRRQSISSSARRVFWGQSLVWGLKVSFEGNQGCFSNP